MINCIMNLTDPSPVNRKLRKLWRVKYRTMQSEFPTRGLICTCQKHFRVVFWKQNGPVLPVHVVYCLEGSVCTRVLIGLAHLGGKRSIPSLPVRDNSKQRSGHLDNGKRAKDPPPNIVRVWTLLHSSLGWCFEQTETEVRSSDSLFNHNHQFMEPFSIRPFRFSNRLSKTKFHSQVQQTRSPSVFRKKKMTSPNTFKVSTKTVFVHLAHTPKLPSISLEDMF